MNGLDLIDDFDLNDNNNYEKNNNKDESNFSEKFELLTELINDEEKNNA